METLKKLCARIPEKYCAEMPGAAAHAFGIALLLGAWLAGSFLDRRAESVGAEAARLETALAGAGPSVEELRALKELRHKDIAAYRAALRTVSSSKEALYGAGAALLEEKRLLEKQLEIMTTWLEIDEAAGQVRLMRGDHSLKDFPFFYVPPKSFGGETRKPPAAARVVSKERFAQPTRGKVEQENGKIKWEPPQVGKDPRSGGLGEYVMFTDGPLVLHGPPLSKELHEAFPHVCAGVTLCSAKRLFDSAFVGTKILTKPAAPSQK